MANGDGGPNPLQVWTFVIAILGVIGGAVGGILLFTQGLGRDYVTAREYAAALTTLSESIKENTQEVRELRGEIEAEVNQKINEINHRFDDVNQKINEINRSIGKR